MKIGYISYLLLFLLLALLVSVHIKSCKDSQKEAEDNFNNFCNSQKFKNIILSSFENYDVKKEITDERLISKISKLIKNANNNPLKKAKLYDISIEIVFFDESNKSYKFEIYKDKKNTLTHIIFVSKYKSLVFSTNDNENIIDEINLYLNH